MPIEVASYAVPRADLGEAILEYNPAEDVFIGTQVLPIRPVTKKAATMSVIRRENMKRVDTKHANGSAFSRATMTAEDKAYACEDYGIEELLTDTDRENYSNDFDAELETVQICRRRMLVEQEVRIKDMIFNTTTWTGAALFTDNSAAPWDAAASDAIGHVTAAKDKVRINTGYMPDTLIIGAVSLTNLLNNTGIKNRFPGAPLITEEMIRNNIASIFGLQNLLVGNAVYDSANDGQAFSGADIWPDDYAMVCKLNTGSPRSGGLGRTLLWTPLTADNVTVLQYREEQSSSDVFRVRQFVDELVFDASFGHLMQVDA